MRLPNTMLLLACISAAAACADDLAVYEEVEDFRLLAIAADKSHLLPGESTTLSALVSEAAEYSWSWCPLSLGSNAGYECAITHAEVQQFADAILSDPAVVPPYDLGSGETAVFPHNLPPAFYRQVCEFIIQGNVPDGFNVPECGEMFEIQIMLRATTAEKSITGVSTLQLLLESDAIPNQNPVLAGVSATVLDADALVELDPAQPTPLTRGTTYELKLDISEDSAESYFGVRTGGTEAEEAQESLVATWFHEGGTLDKSHSAFLPGSIDIDLLRTNEWTPPLTEDHPEAEATLYIVVRDGRGGITWQVREIELVTP